MALPTLEHQIQFVDLILLVRASRDTNKINYIVEEILKSRYTAPLRGDIVNTDLIIFELLGYSIHHDQHVVIFLAEKKEPKGSYDCIDYLPVNNGNITYGKDDATVFKELTLSDLRRLISSRS